MRIRNRTGVTAVLLSTLLVVPLAAQEQEGMPEDHPQHEQMGEMSSEHAAMMEAYEKAGTPGPQHEALTRTAGTWDVTVTMWMDPEGEPMTSRAISTIEPIMDGRYVQETVEGDFMGAPFRGVGTIGYSNVSGEVQGTWIDNHTTSIYTYRGSINEAGDEIQLEGEYTDPVSGQKVETRSVRKIEGDSMTETAWETRNGQEVKTMELTYQRKS